MHTPYSLTSILAPSIDTDTLAALRRASAEIVLNVPADTEGYVTILLPEGVSFLMCESFPGIPDRSLHKCPNGLIIAYTIAYTGDAGEHEPAMVCLATQANWEAVYTHSIEDEE